MDKDAEPAPNNDRKDEHQRVPRSRVLKGAHAAFNQEFSAIPCTVRDMSETGAKVKFNEGWFVPDRFTLFIEVDGIKVDCERVWFRGTECGVRFVGPVTRTGSYRPQVLKPYEPAEIDAPAGGFRSPGGQDAPGARPFRRPAGASHFGKRER